MPRLPGDISLTRISGPHDISSRYFTDDDPFGLVPWSAIGELVGARAYRPVRLSCV